MNFYDTAKRLILSSTTLFLLGSFSFAAGPGGPGGQEDDYTKPCEQTSTIYVSGCGNLPVTTTSSGNYLTFNFDFTYTYLYTPNGTGYLNPMYMEASIGVPQNTTAGNNYFTLYSDPNIVTPPQSLGNKLFLSAPLSYDSQTGNAQHVFNISLHIRESDFPDDCMPKIFLNFFDMPEHEDTVNMLGVAYYPGYDPEVGDIVVFPDGSYYHYEENIETIIAYKDCCSPVSSREGNFSNAESQLPLSPQLYPNPVSTSTLLTYETGLPGTTHISLYDMSGKQLNPYTWVENTEAGIHRKKLDLSDLIPSIYFLRIETNGQSETLKILKQ